MKNLRQQLELHYLDRAPWSYQINHLQDVAILRIVFPIHDRIRPITGGIHWWSRP